MTKLFLHKTILYTHIQNINPNFKTAIDDRKSQDMNWKKSELEISILTINTERTLQVYIKI